MLVELDQKYTLVITILMVIIEIHLLAINTACLIFYSHRFLLINKRHMMHTVSYSHLQLFEYLEKL